jgi:hypothetical protein
VATTRSFGWRDTGNDDLIYGSAGNDTITPAKATMKSMAASATTSITGEVTALTSVLWRCRQPLLAAVTGKSNNQRFGGDRLFTPGRRYSLFPALYVTSPPGTTVLRSATCRRVRSNWRRRASVAMLATTSSTATPVRCSSTAATVTTISTLQNHVDPGFDNPYPGLPGDVNTQNDLDTVLAALATT